MTGVTAGRQEWSSLRVQTPHPLAATIAEIAGSDPWARHAIWAAGLCLAQRRLGAGNVIGFATPPRRGGRGGATTHRIHLRGDETFRQLQSTLTDTLRGTGTAAADPYSDGDGPAGIVLADVTVHRAVSLRGAVTLTVDADEGTVRADGAGGASWGDWIQRWFLAVAAGLDRPDDAIADLGVLTDEERSTVLAPAGPVSGVATSVECAGDLIAAAISAHPQAVAMESANGATLSYTALGHRVAALAQQLVQAGVGEEDLVGILGAARPETVIAICAIWRVGAAFVPLDPDGPAERLQHATAGLAAVVVTEPAVAGLIDGLVLVTVLPSGTAAPDNGSDAQAARRDNPRQLAYVLYTSGSTGIPKGVEVEHASVANYLTWAVGRYHLVPASRVPVTSSVAYDLTITALLAPLLVGGTVVFPAAGEPVQLRGCVGAHRRASLVKVTPSVLSTLRDEAATLAPHVDRLVLGGEAVHRGHITPWLDAAPDLVIENEYGPTEATVGALIYRADGARSPVPIGRPIANTSVYLLDADLQPVPDEIVGEIYLGGAGVARGYRNRPAATAARFVPDPFADEGGQRLYRTGDLAHRGRDGELVYHGRGDRQVKLGGIRTELGEVEAALLALPVVQDAAATVRSTRDGGTAVAAHIVCTGPPPALHELRTLLTGRLHRAAIPASVVVVSRLPTTPAGKVDYASLTGPWPTPSGGQGRGGPSVPASQREELLIKIWADLLGTSPGLDDDFFALGGDSILAIRVAARAREHGLVVQSHQVFELGTIRRLATAASQVEITPTEAAGPGPVPIAPAQQWFLQQCGGHPDGYCHTRAFTVAAALTAEDVHVAVAALVQRHDALRLQVLSCDGAWEQNLVAGIEVEPTAVVDLASADGLRRWSEAAEVTAAGVRAAGPALAYTIGMDAGLVSRLVLAVHHLSIDHVSWLFLIEDLDQMLRGDPLVGTAPSYVHWARLLAPPTARPPAPLPAVPPSPGPADRCHTQLDPTRSAQLLSTARGNLNAEPLDILCWAAATAFSRLHRVDEVCLEVETSGRTDPATVGMVGWFTQIRPVLIDVGGAGGPTRMLASAKDQVRITHRNGASPPAPTPEISVNFLGQVQRLPKPGSVLIAEPQHTYLQATAGLPAGLSVTGLELDGQLVIELAGSGDITVFADTLIDLLHELIQDLAATPGAGVTPGDFARVELDDDELSAVLAQIDPE